jgi:very-short-patch-repair endonuclease
MRKTPSNCYTRGGSNGGQNIVEGEIVVDEVISFAKNFPEKTLGVVTFSVTQRDVIRDLLDKKLRANPGIDSFFSEDRRESFFVRNLETIQGDERDVIFISLGYGRTADGSLHQNFGPLATEGGDRRLNVMITRARERMVVFASLTSEDISLDTGKRGVRALKEFLQLAEKGYMDVPSATSRPFGSPFEEYVSEFLISQGYEVESQVGMSGFFIDLAIRDPLNRNRYLCGIECDGAPYHSSRTARERDRLRQEILESRGWTIYRIWSTDWFRRRKSQEAKLLSYLGALRAE